MRVLTIGNRDPRSAAGGYERIWSGTLDALAAAGHETRILAPPDLDWYWRDGEWIRPGWRERRAIERRNADALDELGAGVRLGVVRRRAHQPAVEVA